MENNILQMTIVKKYAAIEVITVIQVFNEYAAIEVITSIQVFNLNDTG